MTKPIVYHSFEEKAVLEKKLARRASKKDVNEASIALMNMFFLAGKKRRAKESPQVQMTDRDVRHFPTKVV